MVLTSAVTTQLTPRFASPPRINPHGNAKYCAEIEKKRVKTICNITCNVQKITSDCRSFEIGCTGTIKDKIYNINVIPLVVSRN